MADQARVAAPGTPRYVVIRTRGYRGLADGHRTGDVPVWVGVYDRAWQRVVWQQDPSAGGGATIVRRNEIAEARARVECAHRNATWPDGWPSIRWHG